MSHVYTRATRNIMRGEMNFLEAGMNVRVALVMTDTTCDTNLDATTLSAFTLDEFDGTNYARQNIDTQVVNEDTANDQAEFDGVNVQFSNLEAGTRQATGLLIYEHVGADSSNIPIAYINGTGFNFTANGGHVDIGWNDTGGIIQATAPIS